MLLVLVGSVLQNSEVKPVLGFGENRAERGKFRRQEGALVEYDKRFGQHSLRFCGLSDVSSSGFCNEESSSAFVGGLVQIAGKSP